MLCVVVPYRDRAAHLRTFLPRLRAFLNAQRIPATFLVVEQAPGKPFNRGRLLNVGFHHTAGTFEAYCFHDVDLIPLVSDYRPTPHPTHLACHLGQFGWGLPYPHYFGGVTLLDRESFRVADGFPNEFWGWGGEDDALFRRLTAAGVTIYRKPGVYHSLPHPRSINADLYRKNVEQLRQLAAGTQGQADGLATLRYDVLDRHVEGDLTHMIVGF